MQCERVIEVTLPVADPINFCADKDRHVVTALQNTYVGKCFKGAYITSVKRVLAASDCRIVMTNTSGEGTIDVRFLAGGVVFARRDILVGVRVVNAQQILVGEYRALSRPDATEPPARASVAIRPGGAASLAAGQLVAVRVELANHAPMAPVATVVASVLTCDQAAPAAYRLHGSLDARARVELEPMLRRVEEELAARAALVAERRANVWYFEHLLHAYRVGAAGADPAGPGQTVEAWPGGPAWDGPAPPAGVPVGGEARSVVDVVRAAVDGRATPVGGVWSRPLALYRSSPLAAFAAEPPPEWEAPIAGDARAVFAEFLKDILDFLVAVREMATVYGPAELDSHRNVWALMRAAQRPLP